jgi:hypothetical protein
MSYKKFAYDPDGVFSIKKHDRYGFIGAGRSVVPPVCRGQGFSGRATPIAN